MCLKKAKAHNAQHAAEPPPTDTTGSRQPVDPCAGVTCGAVPNGMSACQNGTCVVTSCEGYLFDVDGDAANGCEVQDERTPGAGPLQCSSSKTITGTIASDDRPHDPQPDGFDPTTGSVPHSWTVWAGLCFHGEVLIDFSTAGGSRDADCYLFETFTDGATGRHLESAVSMTGNSPAYRQGIRFVGEKFVYFSLTKTCPTTVREAVTYTMRIFVHEVS